MKGPRVIGLVATVVLAGLAAEVDSALPFRVYARRPTTAHAVNRALSGAARRLADERCRAVLGDFRDGRGRTLEAPLDELGIGASDYLGFVVFADGDGTAGCLRSDVLAVTAPGSRVVQVCHPQFWLAQAASPTHAEMVLVHEVLHTLGLREDPPTPQEITAHVEARCADAGR